MEMIAKLLFRDSLLQTLIESFNWVSQFARTSKIALVRVGWVPAPLPGASP